MGDVTKRRGRVLGMEPDEDGLQTIIAEVPLAELANFTTFIRQTTQGRGWFTTEFARYEILPEMLVPAVVEQARKLGNLDATVIAQAPKMAPHIAAMREKIAACLQTDVRNVSIKATTEEHLGFTGSGEGISAHAVCLLEPLA